MRAGKRILIVDDDESIRQLLGEILREEGYEVECAADGAAALEAAARNPPDVILLDMRMPGMDGWAFSEAYRRTPRPRARIVVISAARDAAGHAAEIAADGFLAKPFDMEALLALAAGMGAAETGTAART